MIDFPVQVLQLGTHTVVPVPFEFVGVSLFDVPVGVTSRTSCGCTKAEHPDVVNPGEVFRLTGNFIKSSKGAFHKTITVTCTKDGVEYPQILSIVVKLF